MGPRPASLCSNVVVGGAAKIVSVSHSFVEDGGILSLFWIPAPRMKKM